MGEEGEPSLGYFGQRVQIVYLAAEVYVWPFCLPLFT